jgi:putative molybdopterin biosynthesis protein
MIRIDIRPVWRFKRSTEREFDFQLVKILAEVEASGKLTQAAERAGISYRHAWNLLADWEAFFGEPLLVKERGRGSTLSPLGERLLWAGRRAQARLAPELANLAAEFERSLNDAPARLETTLAIQASHDFAIVGVRKLAADTGLELDVQFKGSFDALAALRRGECDLAGFHVPDGTLGEMMARRYAEGLGGDGYRVISFVTRLQGLMVRPGNPKRIAGIDDLCRPGVRMVNRQRGSGTRALLEFFISSRGLDREAMAGYENEEMTHGAVGALIAGRQADAGLGVSAAAELYGLDFVPLCAERYVLACHEETFEAPAVRALIALLRSASFKSMIATLPGYSATDAGRVADHLEVFPAPPSR